MKTNNTTISLESAGTETQADAIRSLGEALGAGMAAGVKKAVGQ